MIGSRSYDPTTQRVEEISQNQRFRIYRLAASKMFGNDTFEHYEYPQISGYMLVNRKAGQPDLKAQSIFKMFGEEYIILPDIIERT